MSNATAAAGGPDADAAPANVRVLVRVRPLSDAEKTPGGRNRTINGSSILTLTNNGASSAPMDFGQGGGSSSSASLGSATVTINDGGLGGGGGYGSGYESDYSRSGGSGNGTAAATGNGSKTYQFDAVLGTRSTQADVFSSVRGIVDAVAAG